MEREALPWRGPGPDRPPLPLPPGPMPLVVAGRPRKRWRYVALFAEELMLCAARAEVGPLAQSFWVLWDRERGRRLSNSVLWPTSREVRLDGPRVEVDADGMRASLRLGEAAPVESICPGERAWSWTRKRAGMPVEATVETPGRRLTVRGFGVDDESAGYHDRRTSWRWSAGVGTAADGRPVAWNLVAGVNDPPRNSERAIWVDGEPSEPPPTRFHGEEGVDGLRFSAETEHAREESLLLVRSRYRLLFGTFGGRLGDLELAHGLGVMERHDALW